MYTVVGWNVCFVLRFYLLHIDTDFCPVKATLLAVCCLLERRALGGWRHGVGFPSCGWMTSSTGAFLSDVRRGSAERPGGAENHKATLHRASGAPEAAVTCQECPCHSAEGRGNAPHRQSAENIREEAKVARRIAPSLSSGSLVSAVLLSDMKYRTLLFY